MEFRCQKSISNCDIYQQESLLTTKKTQAFSNHKHFVASRYVQVIMFSNAIAASA